MKDKTLKMNELVDFPEGLDEKHVIKHFGGLSRLEATRMIAEENPFPFTVYTEDLMWMSDAGFTYYFPAYVAACKIVCNQKGKEYVENLCAGILTAIAFRAEEFPGCIINNKEIVVEFISFLEKEAEEMISYSVYNKKLLEINKLLV